MNVRLDDLMRPGSLPASAAAIGVWVPSEGVAVHELERPQAPRRKWRQLLPWLMQDRLLDPPESYAFGIADTGAEQLSVAAVANDTLNEWTLLANKLGKRFAGFIPDFMALPWMSGSVTVWTDGERCLVRNGEASGYAAAPDWVAVMLQDQPIDSVRLLGEVPKALEAFGPAGVHVPDWSATPAVAFDFGGGEAQSSGRLGVGVIAASLAGLAVVLLGLMIHLETRALEAGAQTMQAMTPRSQLELTPAVLDALAKPAFAAMQGASAVLANCSDCVLTSAQLERGQLSLDFASASDGLRQAAGAAGLELLSRDNGVRLVWPLEKAR